MVFWDYWRGGNPHLDYKGFRGFRHDFIDYWYFLQPPGKDYQAQCFIANPTPEVTVVTGAPVGVCVCCESKCTK
jgi:hypothetical protein